MLTKKKFIKLIKEIQWIHKNINGYTMSPESIELIMGALQISISRIEVEFNCKEMIRQWITGNHRVNGTYLEYPKDLYDYIQGGRDDR